MDSCKGAVEYEYANYCDISMTGRRPLAKYYFKASLVFLFNNKHRTYHV